jgi:hypothetical protein
LSFSAFNFSGGIVSLVTDFTALSAAAGFFAPPGAGFDVRRAAALSRGCLPSQDLALDHGAYHWASEANVQRRATGCSLSHGFYSAFWFISNAVADATLSS